MNCVFREPRLCGNSCRFVRGGRRNHHRSGALVLLAHFTPITAIRTSLAALLLPVGALGVVEYYGKGHLNIPAALFIALAAEYR